MKLPDGAYALALATHCRGGWVDLGWYGGESVFTTGDEEAASVVVEGEDIGGLVIRLPSLPEEMFPERCSWGGVDHPLQSRLGPGAGASGDGDAPSARVDAVGEGHAP